MLAKQAFFGSFLFEKPLSSEKPQPMHDTKMIDFILTVCAFIDSLKLPTSESKSGVSLLFFNRHHFVNAALMPSALKGGIEPGIHDLQREHRPDKALTERHHVGIVMLTGQARRNRIGKQRATHPLDLVCRNGNADACGADKNAALTFSRSNRLRRRTGIVGIIAAILAVGAEIRNLKAALLKVLFDGLLQFQTAVVTSHCNFHMNSSELHQNDLQEIKQNRRSGKHCRKHRTSAFSESAPGPADNQQHRQQQIIVAADQEAKDRKRQQAQ